MKQIMREYGSIMIAALVCILLLRVWNTVPVSLEGDLRKTARNLILEKTSQWLDMDWEEGALQEYHSRMAPEISYIYEGRMFTNTFVSLEECFCLSEEGTNARIQIFKILDVRGQEYKTIIQNGVEGFYFTKEGIYMVFLEATDEDGRTTECMIEFAVSDI